MDIFANFNDDPLAEVMNSPLEQTPRTAPGYTPRDFSEPCVKCRGRGRFISYSGRDCGPCFACKGAGKKSFRTSPEKRADARAATAARKERDHRAFLDAHPAEMEWLRATAEQVHARGSSWEFPGSLLAKFAQYGSLTDGQLDAVRACMARETERKAAKAAERAAAPKAAVDVSKIEAAFAAARSRAAERGATGLKNLVLRLGDFRFSPAPATGRNAGAIYVKSATRQDDEGKRQYLGKIMGGQLTCLPVCTPEEVAGIAAVVVDPEAAAVAYGKATSNCACCGAELSNPESIARGIGPICAEKYGW